MSNFVQQALLRDSKGGQIVSWIDAEHATLGKHVKLILSEKVFGVMEVVAVYKNRLPEAWIRERGHDWTRTRRASDI